MKKLILVIILFFFYPSLLIKKIFDSLYAIVYIPLSLYVFFIFRNDLDFIEFCKIKITKIEEEEQKIRNEFYKKFKEKL